MPYTKQQWGYYDMTKTEEQNIQEGNVMTPERMNHIENGIRDVEQETGAFLSSMHDKINSPYINIMFPPAPFVAAIPDGLTDTQPTLQGVANLLAASGGGTVFAPPGNFVFKSGTKWSSGVSLIGSGYRTKFSVSGTIFNLIYNIDGAGDGSDGSKDSVWIKDCRFENFQIDGTGFTETAADASGKGLFILYMMRAVFKNLWIHHTIGTGLGCDFLVDTVIDGVIAENCGRNFGIGSVNVGQSGIGVGTCAVESEPLVIKNCFTRNNGNYGIFVETQQSPLQLRSKGAKITDCYSSGNRIGIGNKGSGGTIISGCDATLNQIGVQVTEGSLEDVLHHNKIYDNVTDGVYVGSDYKGGLKFDHNDIWNNGGRGINILAGTLEMKTFSTDHNDIYDNGYEGIAFNRPITGLSMIGDKIRDNGKKNLSGYRKGIGFTKDVKNFTISLLLCYDSKTTRTQVEDVTFGSGTTLTNGIIANNNVQKDGIVYNDAVMNNVDISGIANVLYQQKGSATIPVNVSYVLVDFPKAFSKVPSTVMIMQQNAEVLWVTDITRFGFFARREKAFGGAVNTFKYVAEI